MNQAANPLDQLRDIHLPDAINTFELAPGWWVIIGLLVITMLFLAFLWYQRYKALRLLKPARAEIRSLYAIKPDNHGIAQLSALLKRVCLVYYARHQVASLSGNQWVDFLNQHAGQQLIDEPLKRVFSDLAYRPQIIIEPELWQRLLTASEQMIEAIIRANAGVKS
jgi:hypothetical protein